jgi:hypothetical protein
MDATVACLCGLYWRYLSPLIHGRAGRVGLIIVLTLLFVYAAAYLPSGPLSLNAIR